MGYAIRWQVIDTNTYQGKFATGTYRITLNANDEYELWFQARYTRGYIKKPGTYPTLSKAKRRARVYENARFVNV